MTFLDFDNAQRHATQFSQDVFDLLCQRAKLLRGDPTYVVYPKQDALERHLKLELPRFEQVFHDILIQDNPPSSLETRVFALSKAVDDVLELSSWGFLMRQHPKLAPVCQKTVIDAMLEIDVLSLQPHKFREKEKTADPERQALLKRKHDRATKIIDAKGLCPISSNDFFNCTLDIIQNNVNEYYKSLLHETSEVNPQPTSLSSVLLFKEKKSEISTKEPPSPNSLF